MIELETRQEKLYQFIKLVKSGRTIGEARSIMKAVSVGLSDRYTSPAEKKALLDLEGGLHRITNTRADALKLAQIKFAPRSGYASNKEEVLAKFTTPYKGRVPLNWKRDGNLIRRGAPNKPKPGSSQGKVGRTRIIGAEATVKRFERFIKQLRDFQNRYGKADTKSLQAASRSVRKGISYNIKGGK